MPFTRRPDSIIKSFFVRVYLLKSNSDNLKMSMQQALINITGKVQGVGFRYSAVHAAQKLNLKGYVRNLPDGRVEALVQGENPSILQFIEWCKEGPAHAKIDQIHTLWQEVVDSYESFEIL